MATNENPSIKSLNELLWLFMRQAAVEAKLRSTAAAAAPTLPSTPTQPAKRRRGSKV
jgi:hypothetical protein